MCLVIDSSILVANTCLYSEKSRLDFKDVRKYSDLLLQEIASVDSPVMFSDDIDDYSFSVGTCEFVRMCDQVFVKRFNSDEYNSFLEKIFSRRIIELMRTAGEKYSLQQG